MVMGSPNLVSSKVSLTLDLPPSCIQFCPAHPELFVVGTYNLQRDETAGQSNTGNEDEEAVSAVKTPQNRNGSLVVFRIEGKELTLVQTLSQPSAILDLRFHTISDKQDILAVVSSTGTLAVFKLDPEQDVSSPLKHLATSRCNDIGEDVLFLQCNWHPVIPNVIGVTTSTGAARVLWLNTDFQITDTYQDLGIANSLEAWCINFSPASQEDNGKHQVTAYCGGDDSMLRYTSLSLGSVDECSQLDAPFLPILIKRQHTAGVTAILPLPLFFEGKGRVVVTGSYDDHLRVFYIQDLHETYGLKRVGLALEENLGGGVWRLDLVRILRQGDCVQIRILASCMHAGARLIDLEVQDGEIWSCNVLARFEEHKSMNYGSDFVRRGEGDGLCCVSTSFYDKLLCVWEYDPSEK